MGRMKLLGSVAAAVGMLAIPAVTQAKVIPVHPGDSIQAAVDKAKPGDKVLISPGTYSEASQPCPSEPASSCAVVVTKDRISIVGRSGSFGNSHGHHKTANHAKRVILKADGDQDVGIDIGKTDDPACLNDPSLRLHGSLIRHLTVQGFADDGVLLYCVSHWRVTQVAAKDDAEYGIFPSHSFKGRVDHSSASGAHDTGLYIGQSFASRMDHNVATDNVSGYEIENSIGVRADHNLAYGNTGGILSFTLPFLDAKVNSHNAIVHNIVRKNNGPNECTGGQVCEVPSGTGILLIAADHNLVAHNRVTGNNSFGIAVANICVAQGLTTQECDAVSADIQPDSDNNRITFNRVLGNGQNPDPSLPPPFAQDLVWDTTGTGNCWGHNVFGTSFPSSLPSC